MERWPYDDVIIYIIHFLFLVKYRVASHTHTLTFIDTWIIIRVFNKAITLYYKYKYVHVSTISQLLYIRIKCINNILKK